MILLCLFLVCFSLQIVTSTNCEDYLGYCHHDLDCCDIDTICLSNLCVPGYRTTPPSTSSGCLYHDLGPDFLDRLVTCHDDAGKKIINTSEDMIMNPKTTCIVHSSENLDIEFFCDSFENYHFWIVK